MGKTQSIIIFLLFFSVTDIYCQDTLSVKDVFNFNIGDLFHYEEDASNYLPGGFYRKVDRITITDKYYSTNMDTVFYERSIEGYTENLVPTSPPSPNPYEWKYYFHTTSDEVFYTDLDSSIFFHLFKEHFNFLSDYDWGKPGYQSDTLVYSSESLCNYSVNGYHFTDFSYNDKVEYGKGLGVTYISKEREECMCHEKLLRLVHFVKAADTCGTPDNRTNTGINKISEKFVVEVFPNPAVEHIFVKLKEDLHSPTLEIYNFLGQAVLQKVLEQSIEKVNLKKMKSGLYYLHISNGQRIKTVKLLKY